MNGSSPTRAAGGRGARRGARTLGGGLADDREEVLRLIGRLKRQRARANGDTALAPLGDHLTDLIDAIANRTVASQRERIAARTARRPVADPASSTRQVDPTARPRLVEHRRRIEELERLRASLERGGSRAPVLATLRKLEQPVGSLEGKSTAAPVPAARDAARVEASHTSAGAGECTMSGLLKGEVLTDVLQMVSSNTITGTFVITGSSGEYTLHFDGGEISHAEGESMTGEEAFFAAFAVKEGSYKLYESEQYDGDRTITANTQFLILEALRQIDESNAGEEA